MPLVVKRCTYVADCSPFGGSVPKKPNYGFSVYVDPVDAPNHMHKLLQVGPTFAREVDATIALQCLVKLGVDWNLTNPRRICHQLFAIVKNDEGLHKVMTEHLQW